MTMDVGKAIRELLFEHPSVIVPGLGGFTSTPETATVDYVQGAVLPPSKKLAFNPNLVINDGMLVHHLQQSNVITFQEAGDAVTRYVDNVKQALERREIVDIPQVGRLYRDYEQKIRFMPEGTNFNADSFGLPTVSFSPITRERKTETVSGGAIAASGGAAGTLAAKANTESGAPVPDIPSATGSQATRNWAQGLMPWLVLLSAVVLATSIYLIFSNTGNTGTTVETLPVDKERLNVKPKVEQDATAATEDASIENTAGETGQDPANSPASAPPVQPKAESKNGEDDKYVPNKRTVFIVVHSFGVRSNATNFAQSLSEAGYAPETRKVGKLFRVGVTFPYNTQQEVEDMKNELGKKFDAKPKTAEELDEMN
ncbi:MAG: SPOR domain-containing protein [Saprospiraceae bacterium]